MRESVDYVEIQGFCFAHTSSCLAMKLRGHPWNRRNGKTCNANSLFITTDKARAKWGGGQVSVLRKTKS